MHIKFTRMEYTTPPGDLGNNRYIESKESVWIPVEVLKQAVVRQEENYYRIFLQKDKSKEFGNEKWLSIEVVKENPIELLKKYEVEKDKERIEPIRKPDFRST